MVTRTVSRSTLLLSWISLTSGPKNFSFVFLSQVSGCVSGRTWPGWNFSSSSPPSCSASPSLCLLGWSLRWSTTLASLWHHINMKSVQPCAESTFFVCSPRIWSCHSSRVQRIYQIWYLALNIDLITWYPLLISLSGCLTLKKLALFSIFGSPFQVGSKPWLCHEILSTNSSFTKVTWVTWTSAHLKTSFLFAFLCLSVKQITLWRQNKFKSWSWISYICVGFSHIAWWLMLSRKHLTLALFVSLLQVTQHYFKKYLCK